MSQLNADKITSGGGGSIDIEAGGNVKFNSDLYIDSSNDRIGLGTLTPTKSLDINGNRGFSLNSGFIREKINITGTAASGDLNHDLQTGQAYLWNTATASWTPNFRYSSTETFASQVAVGQTVGFSVIVPVSAGVTDTYCLGVKIDGVTQTVEWAGGTAPDATAGDSFNYDMYYYQILRTGTGSTDYIVLASQNGEAGGAGGGTTLADMEALNTSLASFSYSQVSSIKTAFEDLGYVLIATPAYNGMAESQSGTTNIGSIGQFNYSEFDSNATLKNSDGFGNNTLNGYPYMLFAGFGPSGYEGVAAMMYRDYSSASLRNFFSPNQNRNLYNFVLNRNGSTVTDTSGGTSTIYSDGQFPNSNGYNSTSRFASDDGCWGFRIGASRLDGNGGPYLQDNPSQAYGCENRNGGDAVDDFFWGNASNQSTTQYCFYFAVKRAS